MRRQKSDEVTYAIARPAFMSVNTSIGWLGMTSALLCAFHSSFLQQKLSNTCVSSLMPRVNSLRILKQHGTLTTYIRPPSSFDDKTILSTFVDASHSNSTSRLC